MAQAAWPKPHKVVVIPATTAMGTAASVPRNHKRPASSITSLSRVKDRLMSTRNVQDGHRIPPVPEGQQPRIRLPLIDGEQMRPFTLFFNNHDLEERFRRQIAMSTLVIRKLFIGLLFLAVISFLLDLEVYQPESSVAGVAVALDAIGAGVLVICFVLHTFMQPAFNVAPQTILFFTITVSGMAWSLNAASAFRSAAGTGGEELGDFSRVLSVLVVAHAVGELLYPGILLASWLIWAAFSVAVLVFRATAVAPDSGHRPVGWIVIKLANLAIMNCVLCYTSFRYEIYRRRSFVLRDKLSSETSMLKQETFELRDKVYDLVLEKFGWTADRFTDELDLTSPLEKAMTLLKRIQVDPSLSDELFHAVTQVATYLGSSDLLAPNLDQLGNDEVRVDSDTFNWLTGLVDDISKATSGHMPTLSTGGSVHVPGTDNLIITDDTFTPDAGTDSTGATSARAPRFDLSERRRMGSMPHVVDSAEEQQWIALLQRTEDWSFDVFEVKQLTKNRPLLFVTVALFKKYDLLARFNIDPNKLRSLLSAIEAGYQDNPYHNSTHAADVLRTVHFFLAHHMKLYCSQLEIMAVLFAACVHDLDHPGVTNQFLINTREKRAIAYSDRSVLESYHLAQAFNLLLQDENNIFENLEPQEYNEIRRLIIELVLATDLRHHFDNITQFKNVTSGKAEDRTSANWRLIVMKLSVKAADVGHTAKTLPLHLAWTERVIEEFYRQGDQERALGLTISPFMDRDKANVAAAQVGFMDFLCLPMYEEWTAFLESPDSLALLPPPTPQPGAANIGGSPKVSGLRSSASSAAMATPLPRNTLKLPCLPLLRSNRAHWKAQLPDPEPEHKEKDKDNKDSKDAKFEGNSGRAQRVAGSGALASLGNVNRRTMPRQRPSLGTLSLATGAGNSSKDNTSPERDRDHRVPQANPRFRGSLRLSGGLGLGLPSSLPPSTSPSATADPSPPHTESGTGTNSPGPQHSRRSTASKNARGSLGKFTLPALAERKEQGLFLPTGTSMSLSKDPLTPGTARSGEHASGGDNPGKELTAELAELGLDEHGQPTTEDRADDHDKQQHGQSEREVGVRIDTV